MIDADSRRLPRRLPGREGRVLSTSSRRVLEAMPRCDFGWLEGRHLRLEARSACVSGQPLKYACMAAVSRSGIRTAARPHDRVRVWVSRDRSRVGRHACVGSMLGESVHRSTSIPRRNRCTVLSRWWVWARTHYISVVCLVAGGYGERWERVAPQPPPRRLRNSGKEITVMCSQTQLDRSVLN